MLWKFLFLPADKVEWLLRCFICEAEVSQSYYYIFNLVLFIVSSEGSSFGTRESMPVLHQTSKEIGADISVFVGSCVLCWHIVKQSSIFVTVSIFNLRCFVLVFSKTLKLGCMDFICFKECPQDFFFSNTAHAPTRHLHQQQTLGYFTFMQAWKIRSWARVRELVNLKSQCFFLSYLVL